MCRFDPALKTFRETILKNKLIVPGDRVLLAFSGGADSMALLSLLRELQTDLPFEICLAHFNHKLRPAADKDEHFVREVAQESGLPLYVGSKDVRLHAEERGLNLEEAARLLRYGFLKKAASEAGATKIATAHTMNDQAETVLMRLMRGTGPLGISGIALFREGTIIRPLLGLERAALESYLRKKKLSYRVDESNRDRRFLRNRIRLELIPHIIKRYDPQIIRHLALAAIILQEEEGVLAQLENTFYEMAVSKTDGKLTLDTRTLAQTPRSLARRVVRRFLRELKGDLRAISFIDVESILGLGDGKERTVKKGLLIRRERGMIFRGGEGPEGASGIRAQYLWDGKGVLDLKEFELKFKGKKIKRDGKFRPIFDDARQAFLDFSKIEFPVLVRTRRRGDRYQPLGAPGAKKLKEIFRAKRIPVRERDRLPVFLSQGQIIWVHRLPVSEKHKISRVSKFVFQIEKQ